MLVRLAELDIDATRLDEYRAFLAEEIEASVRLEPGVIFLFAVAVKDSLEKVRVFEGYADQDAYEAHIRTPHFLRYKTGTADMVVSLKLIETDPIALSVFGKSLTHRTVN